MRIKILDKKVYIVYTMNVDRNTGDKNMKYEELNKAIDLLVKNGYFKKVKPLWDIDLYNIVNQINKNYEE